MWKTYQWPPVVLVNNKNSKMNLETREVSPWSMMVAFHTPQP